MASKIVVTTLLIILLSVTISVNGQLYSLPNEIVILSFATANGKRMVLAKDKKDKYLIYRFGSKNKIDFQYPDTTKSSWKLFKYSFWVRGGGIKNEGIDLNYLSFTNDGFKYILYDTYFAVGDKMSIGVKVVNLKTNEATDIKGNLKTQHGGLTGFRENTLIATDDELYD